MAKYEIKGDKTVKIGLTTFSFQDKLKFKEFLRRIDSAQITVDIDKEYHSDAADGKLKKESKAKSQDIIKKASKKREE